MLYYRYCPRPDFVSIGDWANMRGNFLLHLPQTVMWHRIRELKDEQTGNKAWTKIVRVDLCKIQKAARTYRIKSIYCYSKKEKKLILRGMFSQIDRPSRFTHNFILQESICAPLVIALFAEEPGTKSKYNLTEAVLGPRWLFLLLFISLRENKLLSFLFITLLDRLTV